MLEVLLKNIKQDKNIPGLKLKNHVCKYCVFADNVMFILESPKEMILRLFIKIEEFGELVGFHINKKKTKNNVYEYATKQVGRTGKNDWL